MSTILEALKKSEQERKLNKLPTLSDMPAPQEQSHWPHWVILVLIVLAIALMIMVVSLWQSTTTTANSNKTQNDSIVLDNNSIKEEARMVDPDQDIVVNVVSYSEQANQRFVMINGKMFRENDFVITGVKVVSINPDSVILNQRGKRIELEP